MIDAAMLKYCRLAIRMAIDWRMAPSGGPQSAFPIGSLKDAMDLITDDALDRANALEYVARIVQEEGLEGTAPPPGDMPTELQEAMAVIRRTGDKVRKDGPLLRSARAEAWRKCTEAHRIAFNRGQYHPFVEGQLPFMLMNPYEGSE
ncbi:MAG: hypothetical protein V3W44_05090 [Dehalococcoidales bacterium]